MEFSLFGQQFSLFPIMLSLKVAGLSTLASLVLGNSYGPHSRKATLRLRGRH